jgi:hypothetical protein
MKRLMRYITLLAVTSMVEQACYAGLITGGVGFEGSVTIDTSSMGTATEITGWIDPIVSPGPPTGTFALAPYALTPGMPVTFTTQTWTFSNSAPITNFWSVGGFKFELFSSQISLQAGTYPEGFVFVRGTGIVSGNGYTPTAFTWGFTSQDPYVGGSFPNYEWGFTCSINSLNSNGEPVLVSQLITNATVLSWSDPTFGLQTATNVTGIYSNVPGATSPYTNSITDAQRFSRLKQP